MAKVLLTKAECAAIRATLEALVRLGWAEWAGSAAEVNQDGAWYLRQFIWVMPGVSAGMKMEIAACVSAPLGAGLGEMEGGWNRLIQ